MSSRRTVCQPNLQDLFSTRVLTNIVQRQQLEQFDMRISSSIPQPPRPRHQVNTLATVPMLIQPGKNFPMHRAH